MGGCRGNVPLAHDGRHYGFLLWHDSAESIDASGHDRRGVTRCRQHSVRPAVCARRTHLASDRWQRRNRRANCCRLHRHRQRSRKSHRHSGTRRPGRYQHHRRSGGHRRSRAKRAHHAMRDVEIPFRHPRSGAVTPAARRLRSTTSRASAINSIPSTRRSITRESWCLIR